MTRFNLEGWSLWKWLYGNKELVKVVIPAVLGFLVTNRYLDAAIAGIIGKPILDIVEYYVKK
jgi:hypothetical protein